MRNRELRLAVLLVLAGSALVLLAAGRVWLDLVVPQAAPLPPRSVTRTGSQLVSALSPLGLLGLAGVAALAATRSRGRLLVGLLLLAGGAGAVATTVATLARGVAAALRADPQARGLTPTPGLGFTGWPWLAVAGGVLLAVGGLVVAVRGRGWAALSARYDAPQARQPRAVEPAVAAWDALDRGEDPTGGPRT